MNRKRRFSVGWRRAFYDFLKDLAPVIVGTAVARIAIWDILEVDGTRVQIKDVLDGYRSSAVPALIDLIERRSGVALAGECTLPYA